MIKPKTKVAPEVLAARKRLDFILNKLESLGTELQEIADNEELSDELFDKARIREVSEAIDSEAFYMQGIYDDTND